ncbi:hypothetical protein L1887_10704 [Cichorium endivia]|nr:hypothetical protein L1887_10704 [Cichorium endivia]
MCNKITHKAWDEMGDVDIYIYAPICLDPAIKKASSTGSIDQLQELQKAQIVSDSHSPLWNMQIGILHSNPMKHHHSHQWMKHHHSHQSSKMFAGFRFD